MVDDQGRGLYDVRMLGSIFIVALVAGFFVFLVIAPQEATQIMLALFWAVMILSIPISLIYAMMR